SPFRSQPAGEVLLLDVTRRGEREDATALVAGNLGDDVRRVAKAIETNPLRVAGQPQGAIADQSRAEQWRRLQVRIVLRQGKTEALIGDEVLGIAAIEVVAGEFRLQAQVDRKSTRLNSSH